MRKTLIAIAFAATAIAAPAAAQDAADPVTVTVETGDLDLSTQAGQDRLENRLDAAIRQACRTGGRDLAARRAEAQCRANLGENAAPTVETAVYEANLIRIAAVEAGQDA